jgi:hypothetical protein
VLVIVVLEREGSRVDECPGLAKTTAEFNAVTTWIQLDDLRILLRRIERNAVTSLIEVVVETKKAFGRIVAKPSSCTGFS